EQATVFHDLDPPGNPALAFSLDVANEVDTAPPEFVQGSFSIASYAPSIGPPCGLPATIMGRSTATYCVGFELPIGVPVTNVSASLGLPRAEAGTAGVWKVSDLSPDSTPSYLTMPPPSSFVAHVGGTLTVPVAASPEFANSQATALRITLNDVDDPAPPPFTSRLVEGERWVGVNITLTDVGRGTVECAEGDPYETTIQWIVDDVEFGPRSGYLSGGLPWVVCGAHPYAGGLAPGATATGDVYFSIPVGIPVANFFISVLGGSGQDSLAQWLVP
ncbi:MAG: hypothetical protein ACRDY1_15725, partial [Acidimicrobiales bacterium]